MRKIYAILMTAVMTLAASVSCIKDADFPEENPSATGEVTFEITVPDIMPETKAMKSGWTSGDKLNIWFNSYIDQTPDLVLTYDGTQWNKGALRDPDITFTDGGACSATYEGLNDLSSYSFDENEFKRTATLSDTECRHYPLIWKGTSRYSYDPSTKVVSSTIGSRMSVFVTSVQVVISGLDKTKADKYTLESSALRPLRGFGVYSLAYDSPKPVAGIPNDDGVAFYFYGPVRTNETDYAFTLTDYTGSAPLVMTYTSESKTVNTQSNANLIGIRISVDKFAKTPVVVESVTVTPATLTITEGKTSQLAATVKPDNASVKEVTWSSTNTEVATVDNNGLVTTLKPGKAKIYATAKDGSGKSGNCEVTVEQDKTLKGISLSSESLSLEVGKSTDLTVSFNPDYATNKNVTWSTSNASVATVNNGTVTGVAEGSATITVKSQEGGHTATCEVTVKKSLSGEVQILSYYYDKDKFVNTARLCELYLNDESYVDSYVCGYAVHGGDVYHIQDRPSAALYKNKQYISDWNGDAWAGTGMWATGDYVFAQTYVADACRIYVFNLSTKQSQTIDVLPSEGGSFNIRRNVKMVVTSDGNIHLVGQITDEFNEDSIREYTITPDGKSTEDICYVSPAGNIINLLDIDTNGKDVFFLTWEYGKFTVFKNGKEHLVYNIKENKGSDESYHLAVHGDDVYVSLYNYSRHCLIYKNNDIIYGDFDCLLDINVDSKGNLYYSLMSKDAGGMFYSDFYKEGKLLFSVPRICTSFLLIE